MLERDCYEILGIERNADAATIKTAYQKLAKRYHPDLNPGDEEMVQKFKEASEAYAILGDADKKIKYKCPDCHGIGYISGKKKIIFTIPAGIDTGQSLRIRGKGEPGINGGPRGNLLIKILASCHTQLENHNKKSNVVTCPNCGNRQESGSKFCRQCGQKLTAETTVKKNCPHCGVKVRDGMLFCIECGIRLT